MDQSIPQPRLCVSASGQGRREQNGVVRSLLDETNNRNICSSEISAREDAMRKACSLMREGYVVSHVLARMASASI